MLAKLRRSRKPLDPCPVCGAATVVAEIDPALRANFEIHGFLCDRCGPVKSVRRQILGCASSV